MEQEKIVELLREKLMKSHSNDWSMEVIAEASHLCAQAMTHQLLLAELRGETRGRQRSLTETSTTKSMIQIEIENLQAELKQLEDAS
jgi:hypothetical protein